MVSRLPPAGAEPTAVDLRLAVVGKWEVLTVLTVVIFGSDLGGSAKKVLFASKTNELREKSGENGGEKRKFRRIIMHLVVT